jgi:hypothetical protein
MAVGEIDTNAAPRVLQPIWHTKPETFELTSTTRRCGDGGADRTRRSGAAI